jgi:hypothetical protein
LSRLRPAGSSHKDGSGAVGQKPTETMWLGE